MAKTIKKQLFGKIPVELELKSYQQFELKPSKSGKKSIKLESKTGDYQQYELVKQTPPQEVTKEELKEGLVNKIWIISSYWDMLPKTKKELNILEMRKETPKTNFSLEFYSSPFFDLYKDVISVDHVDLTIGTDKKILFDP